MTWRSESLPPVPETTAAMVKAAFPKGTLYVDLHTEFGFLYDDAAFADLYSQSRGRPVEVAPWRLALVTVMQYMEGLTDRQAADAVRRCMDWKYALSLDLSDPGFNFTLLHDFRERLVYHEGSHQLLDTLLEVCKARGWIKVRGKQRTDSTHVLAAIRTLNRLELALETLRAALNQLSEADPQWVRGWAPLEWYERYGPRAESFRLPKERSKRERLAVLIGVDGYALMDAVCGSDKARHLRHLPDFEALRRIWIQQYYRCSEPGLEGVRWRQNDEEPPSALRIQSPYDLEARYCTKRDTEWVGYKTHLSETCDEGYPDLITQVWTTLSTTPDYVMGPPIQQELAGRDLLPGQHLLDAGYVDAELLVTAQGRHQIEVVGLLSANSGWQSRAATGYGLEAFELDWEAQKARCPQGSHRVRWTPGHDVSGDPVVRIRFHGPTCRACEVRSRCTAAKDQPRQLTVRPQAQHEAIQAARQRQETEAFKAQYALRAGVESSLSQGVRRFDLRRSRYIGLARTQLQQTINATAMNLVRLADWFRQGCVDPPKRRLGRFVRLASPPLFGLTACGPQATG
jgi:transposase